MSDNEILNVLDFGDSKIRFTIFDKKLDKIFSDNAINKKLDNINQNFDQIIKIIKKGEKKIKSHVENIILITDSKETLSIDLSYFKSLDKYESLESVYNNILKEVNHLINSNYVNHIILHNVLNKLTIDGIVFNELPIVNKNIKNIKLDLKFICFPKSKIEELNIIFKKNNINILNIFCTSYVKTISYLRKLNLKSVSFLEMGWERTTYLKYENNILECIHSIPVGSFHITKDISKVLKISLEDAEKIKKKFNQSETEFSYENDNHKSSLNIHEIISKNISIDLLKKVILYRVQEIIDLLYKETDLKFNKKTDKNKLFLIGQGSNLFKNNSFHIQDKFQFESFNIYEELDTDICKSGLAHHINNYKKSNLSLKNQGLFEKFFNFFNK